MLRPRAMSSNSSSSQARTEPPSEARIAEARCEGRGPRAELASAAAATLGALCLLGWAGPQLALKLQMGLRRAILNPSLSPLSLLDALRGEVLLPVCLVLGAVCALMVVSRATAQGFVFSLQALFPSRRFGAPASVRPWLIPVAVFAFGGATLSALPATLCATPSTWYELSLGFGLGIAAVLTLLALLEASLARAAFIRSLWMTRDEKKREERAEQGSPEMRAVRARQRREAGP